MRVIRDRVSSSILFSLFMMNDPLILHVFRLYIRRLLIKVNNVAIITQAKANTSPYLV